MKFAYEIYIKNKKSENDVLRDFVSFFLSLALFYKNNTNQNLNIRS